MNILYMPPKVLGICKFVLLVFEFGNRSLSFHFNTLYIFQMKTPCAVTMITGCGLALLPPISFSLLCIFTKMLSPKHFPLCMRNSFYLSLLAFFLPSLNRLLLFHRSLIITIFFFSS